MNRDLKWVYATIKVLDTDNFKRYDEIELSSKEFKELKRRDGKEYSSNFIDNLQSNIDQYSIKENNEFPKKNKDKIWSIFIKKNRETAYKLNTDFKEQLAKLEKANNGKRKEGNRLVNQETLKDYVKHKGKIILNEKEMIIDSKNQALQVKTRDGVFVTRVKKLFFSETNGKCEICNFSFIESAGINYIELHHKVPFSETGENIREYESLDEVRRDFEFLCSNCHKIVHLKSKNNKE